MNTLVTLPWQEPLTCAAILNAHSHGALLHSGAMRADNARYSYLCVGADEVRKGGSIEALATSLTHSGEWYENMWVGWLGYGLKNQLEKLPRDLPSIIQTDDFYFFKPTTIYRFDHQARELVCAGPDVLSEQPPTRLVPPSHINVEGLKSNMTTETYLQHVGTILDHIHRGNCYQANLTRKFYGTLGGKPCKLGLFAQLCASNPADYSAYMKADTLHVLSSSPELFLHVNADGTVLARPIKGTIARGKDNASDAVQKDALKHSEKDRAENLMIVDLMRNDLSRTCRMGSIAVDSLFDISTHAHIHHMSSHIRGQLNQDAKALDAVLASFPPGSMTGAPKIKAMEICSELEQHARGIYSGALGWFGGDGSAHLSVVIRTLLIEGDTFEFQVGGGIVADSTPQKELVETYHKARGICELLGISNKQLSAL